MLRPKTLRRLVALAVVLAVAAGVSTYVYRESETRRSARVEQFGRDGLTAYAAGDHETALTHLSKYVGRNPDEVEALYAYATSRLAVESADRRHLSEGRAVLNTLLQRNPDDRRVQHALIDVYLQTGQSAELVLLCDRILASDPGDAVALRAKTIALARQERPVEAFAAALAFSDVEPLDLEGHFRAMHLARRGNRPAEETVDRYVELLERHPGDARFELLASIAYGYANDQTASLNHLRNAARLLHETTPPAAGPDGSDDATGVDAEVVRQVARHLDRFRLYEESQSLLNTVLERTKDDEVLLTLTTRLWQEGRSAEALRRLDVIADDDDRVDPRLLATKALALYDLARGGDADPIIAALQRRPEADAKAWGRALAVRFDPDMPLLEKMERFRRSAQHLRTASVVHHWLGEAHHTLGDRETALRYWREAAMLSPNWAAPLVASAQVYLVEGRLEEAVQATRAAERRARNLPVAINAALVQWRLLQQFPNDEGQASNLARLVEEIQTRVPGEPTTLPIQVAMIARTDPDAARQRILRALDEGVDPQTRLRLASVSRANKLGLAAQVVGVPDERMTPALALAQAALAAEHERPEGVFARLIQLAERHGNGPEWRLALARWQEESRSPQAPSTWVAVGDEFPDHLGIQRAILESAESARVDRAFIGRTIDRLRELTGPEAHLWRLERARWLLAGGDHDRPNPAKTSEAITILYDLVRSAPDVIEPRIFLARGLEQAGNVLGAIEHLEAASLRVPSDPRPLFELIRITRPLDRQADLQRYAQRLADKTTLTDRQRPAVAQLLTELGELQRAIQVLDPAFDTPNSAAGRAAREDLPPDAKLTLADLLRRQGRLDEAEALFEQLLARPAPGVEALLLAADFYARAARLPEARRVIDRLDDQTVPPAERAAALARFEERHGDADLARRYHQQATRLVPDRAEFWASWIEFEQRSGDLDAAALAAGEAMARLPNDARLEAMRIETEALRRARENPDDLDALIAAIEADPKRSVQAEVLKVVRASRGAGETDAELATRLAGVAEKYPRFFPVQQELINLLMRLGRTEQAAHVASRTADALPHHPEATRLAVVTARAAGWWPAVRVAADRWKARFGADDPDLTRAADVAFAEASIETSNPGDALFRLRAYLGGGSATTAGVDATSLPDDVALVAARAYAAAGRLSDAQTLLEPRASRGEQAARWRGVWLDIATKDLTRAEPARRWLDRVAALTPPDAPPAERLRLALGDAAFAERFADDAVAARAADALRALADQTGDRLTRYRAAQIDLRLNNLPAAEAGLRTLVASEPPDWAHLVRNDLAVLLLRSGGSSQEALRLAREATTVQPRAAAFQDTLARAEWAAGNLDAAETAFQAALSIDPTYLDALIGLARLHRTRGDEPQAQRLLAQIDALLRTAPPISPMLRQEVQSLRETVSVGF